VKSKDVCFDDEASEQSEDMRGTGMSETKKTSKRNLLDTGITA